MTATSPPWRSSRLAATLPKRGSWCAATPPPCGATEALDTVDMAVRRRVSAAFKDIPGGQVLGPTFDYTHRLLDFALAADGVAAAPKAVVAEEPQAYPMPTIGSVFAHEDLLEADVATPAAPEPVALPGEPMSFPTRPG